MIRRYPSEMRQAHPPATGEKARARLYPFLFAVYPVLFLYRHNIREVPAHEALAAAAVCLAIAIVSYWVLKAFTVDAERRPLLLFLFLLLFHSYGLYYGLISGLLPVAADTLPSHALAFVPLGGMWLLLSWALLHYPGSPRALNRILRLSVACLVCWNLAGILAHHARPLLDRGRQRHVSRPAPARQEQPPDIYCFILDEFAAVESAQSLFRYDNSAFAQELRDLGFFVARNSRCRFQKTEQALASLLNFGEHDGRGDSFRRIRGNAVAASLKQHGYRIIEFPVSPVMFMEVADQRHYYSLARVSVFFNDFYRTLFERSLLCYLPRRWSRSRPDSARYYRQRVLQVFERLPGIVRGPGPKFVYVHLYCPHEPFVFDAQGGAVPDGHFWDHANPRYYLQQYIFTSRQMAAVASLILRDSARPPVVLIQSDHGYRGSRGRKTWQRRVDPEESAKVFNALHLPGFAPESIDPSLAPQNNFRLVFNLYFGGRYPPPSISTPRLTP